MLKPHRFLSAAVLACTLLVATACAGAAEQAQGKAGASKGAESEVAATIGSESISLQQVDEKARAISLQPYQALYDARRGALDQLIEESLLEREAGTRGVSAEALVEEEVTSKVKPVTDADVQNFFNQNQARMRGQTLEQIGGQVRQFLGAQNAALARKEFVDGLRAGAGVKIALDPPRAIVNIAAHDPSKGPATAKVTIVEYSDFQ